VSYYQILNPKKMVQTKVNFEIIPYNVARKADFKTLNIEWITKYFKVEPEDIRVLDFPEENIIQTGGAIFFAVMNGETVGCCGLLSEEGGKVLELVKMAVKPAHQGLKIGEALCVYAIEYARAQGARELYLVSNRKLHPALALYRKVGFVEVPITACDLALFERCDIRMNLVFQ
jgi:N-acetylglutamate synthase-like GNAT family acetyltransferase